MLQQVSGQLRMGMGPVGLDYAAVIRFGELAGVTDDPISVSLLTEALPVVERAIIKGLSKPE